MSSISYERNAASDAMERTSQNNLFSIIIRGCGERTFDVTSAYLADHFPYVSHVSNDPFEATLHDAYEAGLRLDRPWTVMLDGDVIPYTPGLISLYNEASKLPENFIGANGQSLDKILDRVRPVGVRIFRTQFLSRLMEFIPSPGLEARPETASHRQLERLGFQYVKLPIVCGLHAFEQWNADLISTSITLAKKSKLDNEPAIRKWADFAPDDTDYRMIQLGVLLGTMNARPPIVSRDALKKSIEQIMAAFQIPEKEPLVRLPEDDVIHNLISGQGATSRHISIGSFVASIVGRTFGKN